MAEKKKSNFMSGFSGKRSILTILFLLCSVGIIVGVMWWVTEKNASDAKEASDKSIQELEATIDTLKKVATEEDKDSEEQTNESGNSLEAVKAFCYPQGVASQQIVSLMETANGVYANCSLDNAFMIAKKEDGKWTKIWAGNGVIATELCDQYKIPNKMSGGTCNY